MTTVTINRIGTATPPNDIHAPFIAFARKLLTDGKERVVFDRMAERSGIAHRYAELRPGNLDSGKVDRERFYRPGAFPGTGYCPGAAPRTRPCRRAAARQGHEMRRCLGRARWRPRRPACRAVSCPARCSQPNDLPTRPERRDRPCTATRFLNSFPVRQLLIGAGIEAPGGAPDAPRVTEPKGRTMQDADKAADTSGSPIAASKSNGRQPRHVPAACRRYGLAANRPFGDQSK
jgi:hypothetical protein